MAYKFLRLEKKAAIAELVLNRPKQGNALSLELMREIIAAMREFQYDTETRVIILRGEGNNFCVGADLKDPERGRQNSDDSLLQRSRRTQLGRELIETILEVNQITLAVLQGAAAGGGACIASACDFRIASDDCRIGYPEVKLGMNLSWGAVPLCYNLVGPARSRRLIIAGDLEAAQDLLKWGFLDECVSPDRLQERAVAFAEEYAGKPPLAAQMVKRSINALQRSTSAAVMHMDGDQFVLSTESEEYQQQIAAFAARSDKK